MLIHFNASQIFDRMLVPFVVGWVCGLVLAMVYASYYYDSLQHERLRRSTVITRGALAFSAANASLLCETMDPAVVVQTANAANAAKITDTISQKSHHSPLWPRNRVEAAALALVIVSGIVGVIVTVFGLFALREYRKS